MVVLKVSWCGIRFLPKERRHRVQATKTGTIHAAMMSWEVYGDARRGRGLPLSDSLH
jgi:hypothetical protein